MNRQGAETAVVSSALLVAGIYTYRRLVEPAVPANTAKATVTKSGKVEKALGYGPVPPIGRFITGWGVAFTVLALITQVAPNFGGSLAILVAVSDVLGNGTALAQDINGRLGNAGGDLTIDYPTTAGGVPVMQPGESNAAYDKRFGDYLLSHPPRSSTVPNNPLLTNPLTLTPNPLIK